MGLGDDLFPNRNRHWRFLVSNRTDIYSAKSELLMVGALVLLMLTCSKYTKGNLNSYYVKMVENGKNYDVNVVYAGEVTERV